MAAQAPEEYFTTDDGPLQEIKVVERQGLTGVEVHLVNSVAEAEEFMRWLGERRNALAVDTETSGLHYQHGRLRLVQLGDTRHGWAIPADRWLGVAEEALNSYEGPIVMHNSAFDVKWLRAHTNWHAPTNRLHDTMIAAHILNPNRPVGLKPLSVALVDRRANAGELMLKEAMAKQGWSWDTVPIDYGPYWQYGALDTVLTAYLYDILVLPAQQEYGEVYELEMATRSAITEMEWNGARVDVDYCQRKYDELVAYVDGIKEWGRQAYDGANIGSAAQLVKIFTAMGLEIERETKAGKPSVDKYQLRLFQNQDVALAKTILDMRKADKLASSYFSNFLNLQIDGVVHPSIKTLGARTGRMSMTDPALQTLPKGEATVRNAFIPREEDHVIVTCDYSQIEMRLMAHFSQDKDLCQTFADADAVEGGDFFVNIGRDIYRDPGFQKSDKRRGLVKNTLYGKAYGAGVRKMAETAGVPFTDMEAVVTAFDQRYPGVGTFQKFLEQVGNERIRETGEPYVITPFGRRLPSNPEKIYVLTNYLVQGHAAEILKKAIVQLDLAGFGDRMVLPVHDEIVFSIPKDEVAEAIPVIRECMSMTEDYLVPLTAEPEGPFQRWGDKYQ